MEKLYNQLNKDGKYTKTFEEFQVQFGTPEKSEKLYSALNQAGDYTKSFDDFKVQFNVLPEGVVELTDEQVGKTNDSANADPAVESENNTDSQSANGLSELKETEPISNWQSIKNSFSNMGEQVGDVYEYWFEDEGANAALDIATNSVYSAISGQDTIDDFVKEQGKDSWMAEGLGSEATLEAIKKYEIEQSKTKKTKGVIESFKDGNIGGVLAGTINALTSMVGSVAYGAGTLGTGFFMDYVAENYIEYNKLKAENLGVTLPELITSGKADNAIPVGMGALSTGLELIGLGLIGKGVKGAVKGKGGNTGLLGSASKYLAEKLIYSKGARATMNVLGTGATEFTTEILQHASDQVNLELGRVAGTDEEAQIGKTFIDAITSEEGLEAGIQGFLGGAGMTAGSYSAKAMNTIRNVVDEDAANKSLIKLGTLEANLKAATDPTVRKGIEAQIEAQTIEISDLVNKGNDIYNSLDDGDISKIENLRDLGDAALFQVTELGKKLRRGNISQKQYELSKGGFEIEYKAARQGLIDMELDKNIDFAKKEAESRGLSFKVYETTKAIQNAVNKLGNISQKDKKVFKDSKGNIHGFSIGNKILINKEVAKKEGAINVGSHEVLHPVFNKLIGNVAEQGKIVKQFRKSMTSTQRSFVDKQMKDRGYTSPTKYNTEYINVFADALRKKQINYDKTTFEKIGDAIVGIFKPKGYENVSFDNGQDVYNFVKEYDISAEQGQLTEKAAKAIGDVDLSDAALKSGEVQLSKSVAEAEVALQEAQDADPNDPRYFDNLDKAEAELDAAEDAINNPQKATPEVKKEVKPKTKVSRPEKPIRTTELGPRDPISKKIMDTYNEGMEGVERPEYKANKPLPASLERKLVPMFEGYINTIVQQKFKQLGPEALEFQDALSILRAEVVSAIRTFNPKVNKDLAGYVKRYGVQARQSLMFKDANTEFTSDLDDAKTVIAKDDTQTIDRSGTVERGQATFDELDLVDDKLILDVKAELSKELRTRAQKGTLSEMISIKKGREVYMVTWLENFIDKTLFKKILKKWGAIGESKGVTKIPPAYIDFLNSAAAFDIVTKALPIKTIKKSYSKLFKIEKLGREITAEGNPIYNIEKIDKKTWLQYFLDGKKSTILERQKQLAREIITPSVKTALAEYATPENIAALKEVKELAPETALDVIADVSIAAKLSELESKIDRYKGEKGSFDVIQFSKEQLQENTNAVEDGRANSVAKAVIPTLREMAKDFGFDFGDKDFLLSNKAKGSQLFDYDATKEFYNTREKLMEFMPKELTKFRGVVGALLGFVYREDGSYFKFNESSVKKLIDKNGNQITDEAILKEFQEKSYGWYKNNLFDKEGNTSKYSKDSKKLLKEYNKLLKKANLKGNTGFSTNAYKVRVAKGLLLNNNIQDAAVSSLKYLSNNNELKQAAANLYISLLRDFVNASKDKKAAVKAVVIMLVANRNTVNALRALSTVDRVVYDANNKDTEYHFEHNAAMARVIPEVFRAVLSSGPIDFKSKATLVPKQIAKERDSNATTKTSNESVFLNLVKEESDKNNYESVSIDSEGDIIQFSKNVDKEFNNIIEGATGIESKRKISGTKGKVLGRNKGRFKFFIPPSADDFAGLLYRLLGKGKEGDVNSAWFKENLFDPFAKGIRDFETYKQVAAQTVKQLKKGIKNIPQGLTKINETGFTNGAAVRVYLWVLNGYSIPDLSAADQKELVKIVNDNPDLKNFANELDSALDGYPEPQGDWLAGTITTDTINMVNTVKRAEFLEQWQANADAIFSKENLNKLRAAYGDNYVEALQDMLYRMKTGRNRPSGSNKLTNQFMNWVNDSVGTIMFFNTRSAVLQLLSMTNFINWADNNPAAAASAFANQKQFWSDFSMLFNSDFLKQRRSGLKTDVNADDIASAAEGATNKVKAAMSAMLKAGFLPTQMADSFAIAMGGASFVRNRINKYVKEGLSQADAKEQAFLDFQEIAEETQQSSRPDRISQQQASPLGRIILAFANTPMQYMRLTKKAFLDLVNGRGDAKTNISRIVYYMAVQNMIFSGLQAALFASLFEDEDEDEVDAKELRIANSMLDSILRGVGIYGAIAATGKNIVLEIDRQANKDRPDYTQAALRALDVSPPISSKMRKLMSAGRAFSYKSVRDKMTGISLENPAFYAGGQVVSALTNVPLDRAIKKADNLRVAVDGDTKLWQSIALALGYSQWDLGLVETSKSKSKSKKKNKFGTTPTWKRKVKGDGGWKKRN